MQVINFLLAGVKRITILILGTILLCVLGSAHYVHWFRGRRRRRFTV